MKQLLRQFCVATQQHPSNFRYYTGALQLPRTSSRKTPTATKGKGKGTNREITSRTS